jgi:hypothetical protein
MYRHFFFVLVLAYSLLAIVQQATLHPSANLPVQQKDQVSDQGLYYSAQDITLGSQLLVNNITQLPNRPVRGFAPGLIWYVGTLHRAQKNEVSDHGLVEQKTFEMNLALCNAHH